MAIELNSSRRKLARAKEHFANLDSQIKAYVKEQPYVNVVEQDTQNADHLEHKIRLTKSLPEGLADAVGDTVGNLRSTLDHATFALALANGVTDPRNAAFPFAGSKAEFENALKGRTKDVPQKYHGLIRTFEPYKGGNEVLWGLNMLCNADKHRMLTPVGMGVRRAGMELEGSGWFSAPMNPEWDRAKNEIVYLTVHKDTKIRYNFPFKLFVVFEDIDPVGGERVDSILQQTIVEVERVLTSIEAA